MAEHESNLAVLVDFENMARPGAKGRGDFDIHLVLNRLADKGRVLVKRAYADWSRYRDARHELQNAGLGLIEMPSAREGAKNRADIQMAVDAMELAYSREHVDTFVIVSGDSDFTPLIGKLRELNKRVTGVGNRESTSELLIANCDEFIFYDLLAARGRETRTGPGGKAEPIDLLRGTLTALQREGTEWPLASVVKDSMRRKYPAFDESDHGFSTFSKFLEDAAKGDIVRLETDPRSGTYRVELANGRDEVPALPSALEDRSAEPSDAGRRRRRRARRGEGSAAESEAEGAEETLAPAAAETFEFVVAAKPIEAVELPPLDEPISYEDMIMLGPEMGDDLPEALAEATDVDESGPPARSARRRRRRGASAEPEPTVADLALDDDEDENEVAAPAAEDAAEAEAAALEAVAAEAAIVEAVAEAEEAAETPSRRRRRRRSTAADEAEAAEEPVAAEPEPAAEAEPTVAAEEPPAEAVAEAVARPWRRRRSRRPLPPPRPARAAACRAGRCGSPRATRRRPPRPPSRRPRRPSGARARRPSPPRTRPGRPRPARRRPPPSGAPARRPCRPPRRPRPPRRRRRPLPRSGARAGRPSRRPTRPGRPRRPPPRSGAPARRRSPRPRRWRQSPSEARRPRRNEAMTEEGPARESAGPSSVK